MQKKIVQKNVLKIIFCQISNYDNFQRLFDACFNLVFMFSWTLCPIFH